MKKIERKGGLTANVRSGKSRPLTSAGRDVEAARNAFALKMAALHDLSLDLVLAEDQAQLCQRAVEQGRSILGIDRIGIWFADPEDPAVLYGSFGVDESGNIRDEREARYRRSEEALPPDFYEGREPVYYMGPGPCFDHKHEVVGSGEKALALIWDGRTVIGEIWVDNLLSQKPIDGGSLELLVRFARIVGYLTSFKRVQAELKALSEPDDPSGIANRRTVLLVLEKQIHLAARRNERLATIYCRLKGLRETGAEEGREAVNRYLQAVGAALTASVRDCDTVGRIGADSFLVVLPDCDAKGAALIDERIGRTLARTELPRKSPGEGAEGLTAVEPLGVALARGIALSEELRDTSSPEIAQALVDLAQSRGEGSGPR